VAVARQELQALPRFDIAARKLSLLSWRLHAVPRDFATPPQAFPTIRHGTKSAEEPRLGSTIAMTRVEEVFRYLLPLDDRRTRIRQFHAALFRLAPRVEVLLGILMAADLTMNPPNAPNPFYSAARTLPPRIKNIQIALNSLEYACEGLNSLVTVLPISLHTLVIVRFGVQSTDH
jgi:hypothetical protein